MNKAPLPTSNQKHSSNLNSARPPAIPDYFANSSVGKFSAHDRSEENDYAPFVNYDEDSLGRNGFMPQSEQRGNSNRDMVARHEFTNLPM